jgi:hypothetical protein
VTRPPGIPEGRSCNCSNARIRLDRCPLSRWPLQTKKLSQEPFDFAQDEWLCHPRPKSWILSGARQLVLLQTGVSLHVIDPPCQCE